MNLDISTPTTLLILALIAFVLIRLPAKCRPSWMDGLSSRPALLGLLALVAALVIVMTPEFYVLGILGDSAFFDILVLGISLQLQMTSVDLWSSLAVRFLKIIRLAKWRLSVTCSALRLTLDDIVLAIPKIAHWLSVCKSSFSRVMFAMTVYLCAGISGIHAQNTNSTAAGWEKYSGNPVLGGNYGTCFDISVLREHQAYRMWFSWRPKASIALVESKDGFHWSAPVIVLGPDKASGWEDDMNRPVVIKQGRTYHMWYTGQANGRSAIGYATSPDGIVWKRMSDQAVLIAEQPWEKGAVMCPDVIWDKKEQLYKMWYSGGAQYEPDAIGYATSADGLHWAKRAGNPVFKADPQHAWEQNRVTACQIVPDHGWYLMFYIGFRDVDHAQIGVARSKDGVTDWQRLPANPIIFPGHDQWDSDACYKPYAIFDGKKWLLWYNGRREHSEQIGVAIHPSRDLGF